MAKLLYEKKDEIAWVRFNKPEIFNAVDKHEVHRLVEVLKEASADKEVKAIIISSVGDKSFSAGDDLKAAIEEYDDIQSGKIHVVLDVVEDITENLQEIPRVILKAPKTVIAAVKGFAVGAGCEIAIGCDLIIAAENAQFGFPEVSAGMSITGGVTKLLPQIVGLMKAREMFYTGEFIDAQEAYRICLVNKVVPAEEVEKAAEEMARVIMSRAPLGVLAHKRMIHQNIDADFETVLNLEKQSITPLCFTEDYKEALDAFSEKRKPMFKGR